MELDDMKLAWQTLDHRLQQQYALNVQILRDTRMETARRGLRPLAWGQLLQMAIGMAGIALFAPVWVAHLHQPAVLVAGLVMHLYFLGMVIVGGLVRSQIASIDFGAPVLMIQRQLLKLRKTYAFWGACLVGQPWWFMTAPLLVVLTRGTIMDNAPEVIWIQLTIGAVGLFVTGWFYRWAHRPERAVLGRKLERSATGASIRRAQAAAEDIARFEGE